jgi:hypothetical protein
MAIWQKGNLTKWQFDKMTIWQNGKLKKALWQNGNLTKWQVEKGTLTKWRVDRMTSSFNDNLTKMQFDKMAIWQNGKLKRALWQNDELSEWQVDKKSSHRRENSPWPIKNVSKTTKLFLPEFPRWKNKLVRFDHDKQAYYSELRDTFIWLSSSQCKLIKMYYRIKGTSLVTPRFILRP